MSLCQDDNFANLKLAYKNKAIFNVELKTETFLLILEILKNLKLEKKFLKHFPSHIKKLLKKKQIKKILKYLFDGSKSMEKKKRKFSKVKKGFKKWLMSVIKHFLKYCLIKVAE